MASEWFSSPVEVGVKGLESSEQARTRWRNFIQLFKSMKAYRAEMIVTIVVTFIKHGSMFLSAFLISYMAGLVIEGNLDQSRFWSLFWPLLGAILLRAAAFYGEKWWGHDVAYKALRDFRIRIFDKLDVLAPAFMVRHHSGKIGTTLMSDVEQLEWFMAHTVGSYIAAIAIVVVALVFLATINGVLALVMTLFAALATATPFFLQKVADVQGREVREKMAQANKSTMEGIQGLRELMTLNGLARYRENDRKILRELYDAQYRYGRRQGVENGLLQLFVGMFTVFVMAFCAMLVTSGQMDFAWYPAAVMMSTLLFSPIMEVSNVARNLGNVTGAADRIQRVLDETEEVVDDGPDVDMVSLGTPRIVFDDVSFSYDESTAPALKGVSFTVEPGETVALVGPSGAGKTTCSSLLLRTWDVDSGSISVAGRDIREMSLDSLHTLLSAVLQDSYLFNMPVRENIRLGRLDASDDEVEAAAKTAHIHDFIESLPAGYDTMTGERGSQLSGGQRQRISIARAVLKNAPILILDEAVSNLDTENERAIQKALDEQLAGRTSLVIAHRLSTILSADRIVVLNAGRVEADGTHAELLATSEFYRKLIELQLAKEQEDAEE